MDRSELAAHIFRKGSYLCVGLDTDIDRLPPHLLQAGGDPVFAFNKAIIDATRDWCVAYKINTAFYESRGAAGWETLARTAEYIPDTHFRIADAKRGDIGNTSRQYARAFFEAMPFDAVTVAPYMGKDSITPFLEYEGKWTILLGVTSNGGSRDFQLQRLEDGELLYEKVIREASGWGSRDNLMFVVGATRGAQLENVRRLAPEHFFLVPGVGAQGGDLKAVSQSGLTLSAGLLVNASRSVIYAGTGEDFAEEAKEAARRYCNEMKLYLEGRYA
jgi:orotidine-5'-phosphate decarboxylase